jgi:hypothetical protein
MIEEIENDPKETTFEEPITEDYDQTENNSSKQFFIPASVSKLNRSNNKYSMKPKIGLSVFQELENIVQASKSIKIPQSEEKIEKSTPKLKNGFSKNLPIVKNLKDYVKNIDYTKLTSNRYSESNQYKQEISVLSNRLLYISIPTLISGIISIFLFSLTPSIGVIGLLSLSIGTVIFFIVGIIGIYLMFYNHKFKIDVDFTSNPPSKDLKIIEKNGHSVSDHPEENPNSSNEFEQYLQENKVESPYEEKMLDRYGHI